MVKSKKKPQYYSVIPTSTIRTLMGEKRWKSMMKEVKKKYGTDKVLFEYTVSGPLMRLRDPFGKSIGSVADVEEWSIKQRKKR